MRLEVVFANIISYVLHPIFLPTYAIAFLLWSNPYYFMPIQSSNAFTLFANVVLNSVLLPLMILTGFKRLDLIKDLELSERKQRALPFLVIIAFLMWTYLVVVRLPFSELISDVVLGAFISMMCAYFINVLYVKVSLHTIGMGNFLAIVLVASAVSLYGLAEIFMITIILAGLVGTSRLILKAHYPYEVYLGYMVGFVAQVVAFML